jgi:arabinan endo-1,5-alpha-L-arabinosidase
MTVSAGTFELVYDPSIGEHEPWYINDHTFVRDGEGTWHLIGITHAEPANPFDEKHLAHATAPALHGPWTKQPFALSTDASAGETHLWAPHVIHHDDRYWMFVCGGGEPKSAYRIQLATSDDCTTWTRHPQNPMRTDGYEARDPMVLRVDDRWVMYYTATSAPEGGNHIVAAATSDDLVHWSGRHQVYVDELVGTGAGPTESPFVVARDGRYYLFIGPSRYGDLLAPGVDWRKEWKRSYSCTIVLESDDPLHFERSNEVGFIEAHASEVIVDADGSTWISHCGWGEGGVYLAPLTWT